MKRLLSQVEQFLPDLLRKRIRSAIRPNGVYGYERDLGTYIIDKAKELSERLGGKPEAFDVGEVREAIFRRRHLRYMNEVVQHLQAVFMPNYERNLFDFYRQQQYLILLTFLSYPFRGPGCLFAHVQPFIDAGSKLDNIRAIDYGAGLPFGLIHLMRTRPDKVKSVTIVDQDLIHTRLAEYILSGLCGHTDLFVNKVSDAEAVCELGDQKFNLIYGKDVFEHLTQPEQTLRLLLDRADTPCLCYLDIRDHEGEHLQHVNPRLANLGKIVTDYSFISTGQIGGLSAFVRTE